MAESRSHREPAAHRLGIALLVVMWTGLWAGLADPADAQNARPLDARSERATVAEARSDRDGDSRPDRMGDTVTVAARALHAPGQLHDARADLYVQGRETGIALRFPEAVSVEAGDSLLVRGVVGQDNGLVQLNVLAHRIMDAPPQRPAPASLSVSAAAQEANEGRLARVEGVVVNRGTNAGGHYLVISDPEQAGATLTIFVANPRVGSISLDPYERGDRVRVTGVLSQYDFDPPYDDYYQILPLAPGSIDAVGLTQRTYRYAVIIGSLLLLLTFGGVLFLRYQVKERTRELAESEARMRSIFEGAAPGIALLDANLRLDSVNPALERILDRDAETLHDTSLEDVLHADEVDTVRRAFHRIVSGSQPRHQDEHRFRLPNGTTLWGQLSMSRLPDTADGSAVRAVAFVVDVTERKELEDQLRRAQKMETVGTLAGGVAHDFNNILHAALVYVRMGRDDVSPDSPSREFMDRAVKGLERAEELVDQLLAFSRKESTSVQEAVDLADVVQESIDLVEPSAPHDVTLRVQLDDDCVVMGDPGQLRQVATNLMTNALQAMEDVAPDDTGHTLDVRVREIHVDEGVTQQFSDLSPGPHVRLAVSDTGPGMAESTRERIFEPFFTTKSVEEGTGLGLAVVHGIVEGHDGAIDVHTQLGEGTTFHVYIPVAPDDAGALSLPTDGEANRHVLLIEDDAQTRELEAKRLRHLGCTVTTCRSSPEALTTVSSNDFDLVVTDHVAPNVKGIEFAKAVRHQGIEVPIVMVSSFSAQVSDAEIQDAGVECLLQKPVSTTDLEAVLDDVLG
jgi:PAS domain S-box-containing protein